jgi:hypothetical protein
MFKPASNQNETGNEKRMLSEDVDEDVRSKLPRKNNSVKVESEPVNSKYSVAAPAPQSQPRRWRFKFLPAFWTIASVMSMVVNVVLIIIVLILFQMFGQVRRMQVYASNQATSLLGGLYTNFVKMDDATISTTIPVDAMIPLNITVPVQTTTQIHLAESVTIPNAHVRIATGGLNIDANAVVTLPVNTPLTVKLDFPLQVQNSIPIHLDVPVNIPLNHTELHEPFVGLQKVVEPWYCLVKPDATVNGLQVCSASGTDPTLIDPSLRTPIPAETVVP